VNDALDWSTIEVSGEDAATFLDGQISQEIDRARGGAWTALLEPDGVVVSAGWLRVDGDFKLLVPSELAEATRARLARFRLRVKVSIDVLAGAGDPPLTRFIDLYERQLPWSGEFAAGLPPHGFGAAFVARTISFDKGCFTGQELVARMDVRGASSPFRFARVRAPSRELADEVISAAGPPRGQGVTTVFADDGELLAHAVVHRSLIDSGGLGDVEVEAVP
jgi:folate-binding protein YgfZ